MPPNIPISSLTDQIVMGTDERSFPAIDDDRLVGLVRSEDVLQVPREGCDTKVGEMMTRASRADRRLAKQTPIRLTVRATRPKRR